METNLRSVYIVKTHCKVSFSLLKIGSFFSCKDSKLLNPMFTINLLVQAVCLLHWQNQISYEG